MDTHSFGPKKYQKKGQKNRKKGEKSCQEYQWYINYWPPCPGFGPKNGQKKTKTNLKTTYSKNHDGHINYLPTSFTKKKTFDTRDSRVVPHRSTDRAQWCLTSQFGWDAVYPPWYDRMMECCPGCNTSLLGIQTSENESNVSSFGKGTDPCWCSW